MIQLYLDANVYLTFYHLTSDDLEELRKLVVLVKDKRIQLHVPEQTFDEFYRNRENRIAESLKLIHEEKLNNTFPRICRDFPEFREMNSAIKTYNLAKANLISKLEDKISTKTLEPDRIVDELFSASSIYGLSAALISQSRDRFDIGRPPGKKRSYGDALNWETLLQHVDKNVDLHFVSDDGDYFSVIEKEAFNPYLSNEWRDRNGGNIIPYRQISQFFRLQFPQIQLASEYEKQTLIDQLSGSRTFASSRRILNRLVEFDDFTEEQLNSMIQAFVNNSQILWIREDEDIAEMINKIVEPNVGRFDQNLLGTFVDKYSGGDEPNNEASISDIVGF